MRNGFLLIVLALVLGLGSAYLIWGDTGPLVNTRGTENAPAPVPHIAEPQTKLQFEPAELDLGEVLVGSSVSGSVRIKNPTGKPITISNLHPSCHCLEPALAVTTIAPGTAEKMECKYTAQLGRSNDTVSALFTTDEEGAPAGRVAVHAHVKEMYILEPRELRFAVVRKGETKTQDAVLKSVDGQPFQIQSVTMSNPQFSFKWTPLEGSHGTAYTLTAAVSASKTGPAAELATILTDRAAGNCVSLPVSVRVTSDVACEPTMLAGTLAADNTLPPFDASVLKTSPGKLEILNVTEGGGLRLDFSTERIDDSRVKLTIKLKDPYVRKAQVGQFLIQTSADDAPVRLSFRVEAHPGDARRNQPPPPEIP